MHNATRAAVEAFEDVERVRLLLAKKEDALSLASLRAAHLAPEDQPAYFEATAEILAKYEAKAEKAGVTL